MITLPALKWRYKMFVQDMPEWLDMTIWFVVTLLIGILSCFAIFGLYLFVKRFSTFFKVVGILAIATMVLFIIGYTVREFISTICDIVKTERELRRRGYK